MKDGIGEVEVCISRSLFLSLTERGLHNSVFYFTIVKRSICCFPSEISDNK